MRMEITLDEKGIQVVCLSLNWCFCFCFISACRFFPAPPVELLGCRRKSFILTCEVYIQALALASSKTSSVDLINSIPPQFPLLSNGNRTTHLTELQT